MTLYEELTKAGVAIDHHESDLYVPATPQAEAILRKHPCRARRFVAQDGTHWWDAPFMYDPFWVAS